MLRVVWRSLESLRSIVRCAVAVVVSGMAYVTDGIVCLSLEQSEESEDNTLTLLPSLSLVRSWVSTYVAV